MPGFVSSTPATVPLALLTMLKVSGFILTTIPVDRRPGPFPRTNTLSKTALLVGKQGMVTARQIHYMAPQVNSPVQIAVLAVVLRSMKHGSAHNGRPHVAFYNQFGGAIQVLAATRVK